MTRDKDEKNTYKARAIRVKNDTPLASILDEWSHAATRLYNSATFLNRNTITGLNLPETERHPNQQYAIDEIENILPKSKRTRWKSTARKLDKLASEIKEALQTGDEDSATKKKEQGKKKRESTREAILQENILNQHHRRANYSELDAYYKFTNHEAYRSLPAHAAQNILKEVNTAWDNWGEQLHDWRCGNAMGLTGRPGMPYYKDKKTSKALELPAADIVIVEREESRGGSKHKKARMFAQLPLIKGEEPIEITGLAPEGARLVTVQINPVSGGYDVVFVYKKPKPAPSEDSNLAGGDLGLDNLLTMVVNDGVARPLIIDGKELKSINQYWNKKIAELKSELPQGVYSSKRIDAAWEKRRVQLHDRMNEAANIAVAYLVEHQVREFVVGKNDGWKENFAGKVPTRRKSKQDFVFMPYECLLDRLEDKCADVGISLVKREESYTSKASLVDGDAIPTYGVDERPVGGHKFSGSRVSRGVYRSKRTKIGEKGLLLNADVNGAGNILRKEHVGAFGSVSDWRYLMNPERVRLSVLRTRERVKDKVSRDGSPSE